MSETRVEKAACIGAEGTEEALQDAKAAEGKPCGGSDETAFVSETSEAAMSPMDAVEGESQPPAEGCSCEEWHEEKCRKKRHSGSVEEAEQRAEKLLKLFKRGRYLGYVLGILAGVLAVMAWEYTHDTGATALPPVLLGLLLKGKSLAYHVCRSK